MSLGAIAAGLFGGAEKGYKLGNELAEKDAELALRQQAENRAQGLADIQQSKWNQEKGIFEKYTEPEMQRLEAAKSAIQGNIAASKAKQAEIIKKYGDNPSVEDQDKMHQELWQARGEVEQGIHDSLMGIDPFKAQQFHDSSIGRVAALAKMAPGLAKTYWDNSHLGKIYGPSGELGEVPKTLQEAYTQALYNETNAKGADKTLWAKRKNDAWNSLQVLTELQRTKFGGGGGTQGKWTLVPKEVVMMDPATNKPYADPMTGAPIKTMQYMKIDNRTGEVSNVTNELIPQEKADLSPSKLQSLFGAGDKAGLDNVVNYLQREYNRPGANKTAVSNLVNTFKQEYGRKHGRRIGNPNSAVVSPQEITDNPYSY